MKIGKVYANSAREEHRADQTLIEMGAIVGDGLLGVVVEAICELVSESGWCGYYSNDAARFADAEAGREAAWVALFAALKAIEEWDYDYVVANRYQWARIKELLILVVENTNAETLRAVDVAIQAVREPRT